MIPVSLFKFVLKSCQCSAYSVVCVACADGCPIHNILFMHLFSNGHMLPCNANNIF